MSDWPPNQALQRFEGLGKARRRISLHRMKRKAEGRVCGAAHESHCNRLGRFYAKPRVSFGRVCEIPIWNRELLSLGR